MLRSAAERGEAREAPYARLPIDDPTLNVAGGVWSADGARLAGEGWDDADATRNGIYTRRASDGGGLIQVTSNPIGGHDVPGDYSPDGSTSSPQE